VQVTWGKETPWYEGLREVHPAKATGAHGNSPKGSSVKGNGATGGASGITAAATAGVTAPAAKGSRKRTTRVATRKS
jgi:hypothetical protein